MNGSTSELPFLFLPCRQARADTFLHRGQLYLLFPVMFVGGRVELVELTCGYKGRGRSMCKGSCDRTRYSVFIQHYTSLDEAPVFTLPQTAERQ